MPATVYFVRLPASVSDRRRALFGRRDVLRIGGFTVATAAVISACGEHVRGEVGRVGAVPTTAKLPDAVVTNVALLRTASSLEHSIDQRVRPDHRQERSARPEVRRYGQAVHGRPRRTCRVVREVDHRGRRHAVDMRQPEDRRRDHQPGPQADHQGCRRHGDVEGRRAQRRSAPRRAQLRPRSRDTCRCHVPGVGCLVLRSVAARRCDDGRCPRSSPRSVARADDQPRSAGRPGQLRRCGQRRAGFAAHDGGAHARPPSEHRQPGGGGSPGSRCN